MSDVLDILDAGRTQIEEAPPAPIAKRGPKPKPPKPAPLIRKKPEGMHRELFNLLQSTSADSDVPLLPTDFGLPSQNSYKQIRANLSIKQPRKWRIKEFTNSARKDGLILKHWERLDMNREDYSFAKFNIKIDSHIPKYDDNEYNSHLVCDQWTKEETDHLMQLCSRFDLRFLVIHDRWDRSRFKAERIVEDLKERYYFVHNQLAKCRTTRTIDQPKLKPYDWEGEKKRKQQLINLYNRTEEEIQEELDLLEELRKIEDKKKVRERKRQDLQKNLDAGRIVSEHHKRSETTPGVVGRPCGSGLRGMPGRRAGRPGRGAGRPSRDSINSSISQAAGPLDSDTIVIKFADCRTSGTYLRSQRLKLPSSLGAKKLKALEQMVRKLELDQIPMATDEICQKFNQIRGDLLLLFELKVSLANTEVEINELTAAATGTTTTPDSSAISDVIDIDTTRKRRAALDQGNILKKLKNS